MVRMVRCTLHLSEKRPAANRNRKRIDQIHEGGKQQQQQASRNQREKIVEIDVSVRCRIKYILQCYL